MADYFVRMRRDKTCEPSRETIRHAHGVLQPNVIGRRHNPLSQDQGHRASAILAPGLFHKRK